MIIEVYINKNDMGKFDVDVFELNSEREEELTSNDFPNIEKAEDYVRTLIKNKELEVYYKGIF